MSAQIDAGDVPCTHTAGVAHSLPAAAAPAAPPHHPGNRATERDCQQTIVDAARLLGYHVLSIRPAFSRGKYSSPIQGDTGYPDLTLAHPTAGVMHVELKRHPNKLEPDQIAWARTLLDAGATWRLVWVPEQQQSFIDELTNLSRKPHRR